MSVGIYSFIPLTVRTRVPLTGRFRGGPRRTTAEDVTDVSQADSRGDSADSAPQSPPPGRYGDTAARDARADRRLKILGAVLGTAFLAMIGWFGYSHISSGNEISAELIKFQITSDEEVRAHLEVRKGESVTGVCTVRALTTDKAEVGRREFTFDQPVKRLDEIVSIRTTARAGSAQLIGCRPADH
ncbi:DUF4307 domain-containing protein [Streptomyces alkaliterrae]|uniref:DUF4307 domain-containing protein n=1 Tax=Streptomyces alkaliterrae TaxID=2213162 RepID=A0A5P0YX11_9ACTN|nr:DUF4307 domain-containing protein [Streptomyces alkaliterrae]MBB1262104.1 DUF4307 domain-containing protein [Streptomyces alkaliterrae]MQS03029.1 DUF4307 domain-containing protein [Streptomyces alkaliterrae]